MNIYRFFVFIALISSLPLAFLGKATGSTSYPFNINMNITTASCTVTTKDLVFNLYTNALALEGANTGTDWQSNASQSVRLINCFGGTRSVIATVSGVPDGDDKDGFKNQEAPDKAADGVSVQLKSGDKVLHNGDTLTADISEQHSVEIPLAARLYTVKGNVKPGTVYSVVNLTLSYK